MPVRGLALHGSHPQGNRLAVAFGDPDRDTKPGPVFLLDATTLETLFPLPVHVRAAECVTFSADGAYVLSGGADEVGRLSLLPALADRQYVTGKADPDPKPIGRYAGHARPMNAAIAVPSAGANLTPIFATGSGGRAKGGNELRVWRFEPTGSQIDEPADADEPAGGEGETKDQPTGKVRDLSAIADFAGPVRSLALSADGTLLAAGDDSGAVRVYRVRDLLGDYAPPRTPLLAPKPAARPVEPAAPDEPVAPNQPAAPAAPAAPEETP